MSFRTFCSQCHHPIGQHAFVGKWKVRNRSAFVGLACARHDCDCSISIPSVAVEIAPPAATVPRLVIHEAKLPGASA